MRSFLVLMLLGSAIPVCAQTTSSPAPQAPDSTYLLLTLELPVHGTFTLTRTSTGQRQSISTLARRVAAVEIQGCVLQWRVVQHTAGRGFGVINDFTLPLKELELKTVEARPAGLSPNERLDPTPWQVVGSAVKGKKSVVTMRNPDAGTTSRTHMFSIMVSHEEPARRFATAIKDAATRCDTWRTAPLPVIR